MKKRFFQLVGIFNVFAFSFYLFAFTQKENAKMTNLEHQILKVKGIVIVDSLGIERVIIGSHLPEPNFANGNRLNARGKTGSVSGVMLYDAEGQERGGYVTDDYYGNAFMSLDSKASMPILLIAEPQGSGSLLLNSRNGKNKVNISVSDDDGTLYFKKNNKDVKIYGDEK